MRSNRLQLNSSKTEVMWCATRLRQRLYNTCMCTSVDGVMVDPVTSARVLGIFIDVNYEHTRSTNRVLVFAVLRQLRQIRKLVPPATLRTLAAVLILLRAFDWITDDFSTTSLRQHYWCACHAVLVARLGSTAQSWNTAERSRGWNIVTNFVSFSYSI